MTIPVYYPDNMSSNATSVIITNTTTSIGTATFNPSFGFPLVTSLIFMDDSVCESIGFGAFAFSKLTSLVFPDSITNIGVNACKNMTKLTSITLSQNIPAITDGMFQNCYLLPSIQLTNSVISIGISSFQDCTSLTKFVVLSTVITIDNTAFLGCTNLIKVICFNPNLIIQLQTMLPNATVQSYDEMILGVEQVSYVNKLQNTIVYGRFRNSDDVTTRNIQCDAVFDRKLTTQSLVVSGDATIGTLNATTLKQNGTTLDDIFVTKLSGYQTFGTALGKTYSVQYTANATALNACFTTPIVHSQLISVPANCVKIDVMLFGSGGISGLFDSKTSLLAPGVGSGGGILIMNNLLLGGSGLTLNIGLGLNGNSGGVGSQTTLLSTNNGDRIAAVSNGNAGTNAFVSNLTTKSGSIGSVGSINTTAPVINTLYVASSCSMYGSQGQPTPVQNATWTLPVPGIIGGYAGGNGKIIQTYTGIFGSFYSPPSIGAGQSSPQANQIGANNYTNIRSPYIGGGAIITYYLK